MPSLKKIPWEIIIALLGAIPALLLLKNYLDSRSPQIKVKNELAFPIQVYVGDEYQVTVPGYSRKTIRFYSEKVFPVQMSWVGIRQETQNGGPVGDVVTGMIEFVDNHQEITVTHTAGEIDYFMPVLTNETDTSCKIYVNDGLPSEQYVGFLLPGKKRVNVGYYKWYINSNVTLYCNNDPHWWGDRNGKEGPKLKVKSPSGETDLTLRP